MASSLRVGIAVVRGRRLTERELGSNENWGRTAISLGAMRSVGLNLELAEIIRRNGARSAPYEFFGVG